jgi:hypothetical protein
MNDMLKAGIMILKVTRVALENASFAGMILTTECFD